MSATPIGVNAAMTSPLAAAAANQAAGVDPWSTAKKDAIALIKISARVGAATRVAVLLVIRRLNEESSFCWCVFLFCSLMQFRSGGELLQVGTSAKRAKVVDKCV
jgi:hypothetical protein